LCEAFSMPIQKVALFMLFEDENSAWYKCSTGIFLRIERLAPLGRGFLDDDFNGFAFMRASWLTLLMPFYGTLPQHPKGITEKS